MLLIVYEELGQTLLVQNYSDKVKILNTDKYDTTVRNWLTQYISDIKVAMGQYEIVIIKYISNLIKCLQAVKIEPCVAYRVEDTSSLKALLKSFGLKEYEIQGKQVLQDILVDEFGWLQSLEREGVVKEDGTEKVEQEDRLKNGADLVVNKVEKSNMPLTMEDLVKDELVITDSEAKEFKLIENKLKAGMLLQAKSSLNRIIKLTNILDKLYDELLDRIENSLETADTSSLFVATDNISKALNDTNNFIMTLINNEKIQNFFVIEQNNIVNVGNDAIDAESRERVRKAAEIVLNNLDYFANGEYNQIVNPNK